MSANKEENKAAEGIQLTGGSDSKKANRAIQERNAGRSRTMITDTMIDPDLKMSDLAREVQGLVDLQQPNSILTWHVTLQFDRIYTYFYCTLMFVIHIYKGK